MRFSTQQVVAVATYCAILVPRAHLLAEAMTQGMFMASMYQLFCLLMAYCGGEANLIASVKPQSLDMQVPPCCCWPCCWFLPKVTLTKYDYRVDLVVCKNITFKLITYKLQVYWNYPLPWTWSYIIFVCVIECTGRNSV